MCMLCHMLLNSMLFLWLENFCHMCKLDYWVIKVRRLQYIHVKKDFVDIYLKISKWKFLIGITWSHAWMIICHRSVPSSQGSFLSSDFVIQVRCVECKAVHTNRKMTIQPTNVNRESYGQKLNDHIFPLIRNKARLEEQFPTARRLPPKCYKPI